MNPRALAERLGSRPFCPFSNGTASRAMATPGPLMPSNHVDIMDSFCRFRAYTDGAPALCQRYPWRPH